MSLREDEAENESSVTHDFRGASLGLPLSLLPPSPE
jgi:hypothetical protein